MAADADEDYGDCFFCKKPIKASEDKTSYGGKNWRTGNQNYVHWNCYHDALNARIGANRD
jgi:hypothetical protein